MAVLQYNPAEASETNDPGIVLSASQAGNGDSTNTLDRGGLSGPAGVVITNVAGATPTVTVNILASVDGINFYNVSYALVATPSSYVVSAITITTATTTTYLIEAFKPWRFLKLNYSANTNETLSASAWSR